MCPAKRRRQMHSSWPAESSPAPLRLTRTKQSLDDGYAYLPLPNTSPDVSQARSYAPTSRVNRPKFHAPPPFVFVHIASPLWLITCLSSPRIFTKIGEDR